MVVTAILSLLCGLVLFLYGVMLMGDGLNQVAGGKLEAVLYKLTSHPIKGIALGADASGDGYSRRGALRHPVFRDLTALQKHFLLQIRCTSCKLVVLELRLREEL